MPSPIILEAASILSFTTTSKGKGRGSNDKNNKTREAILSILLTPAVDAFKDDAVHGPAWTDLAEKWRAVLLKVADKHGVTEINKINVTHRGGRCANYDYDVAFMPGGISACVEFKYESVPQFVSLPANKKFHTITYAEHYYDNDLTGVMALYGIEESQKPERNFYLENIYNNDYEKIPVVKAMYDAECAERAAAPSPKKFKPRQTALVNRSIQNYLAIVKDSTDLAAIQAEYARTQKDKHYVIYKKGEFHLEHLSAEELIPTRIDCVKGNKLITESAIPGVYHHMLLRWKNHAGILYPAWQISIVRPRAKVPRVKKAKAGAGV